MTDRFYPRSRHYFAMLRDDRPLFQGDIIRGVFGAWWRHPESMRATLAGETVPTGPQFPRLDELRSNVLVRGKGFGMLLPQPCEFSEGEKGATQPFRVVAPLFPLDRNADVDHDRVRRGSVGHTIWVPRWSDTGPQDYYVDLRWTSSVDAAFIDRTGRVAALSRASWLTMVDRLSRYFVGVPVDVAAFAVNQAHLHPDSSGDR